MNVFSDFAMLLLPIESIWRLQMATKQKVGITAVFAVGLL
jgi:large subunit ribosomal protein L36e